MKKYGWLLLLSTILFGCSAKHPQPLVIEQQPAPADIQGSSSVTPELPLSTSISQDSLPGLEIFTFSEGEPGWYIVNDTVMGGVSQSQAEILPGEILNFTGTMSLDNNGGFASVRSDWLPMNLAGNDGVLIRVQGDGNFYRLRIRTTETGGEVSYNALFPTEKGEWRLIYVPFSIMVPTYRGFVMDVGALDPTAIASFGFMLSDKQEGEFEFRVDWIRAVSETAITEWENVENVYRIE